MSCLCLQINITACILNIISNMLICIKIQGLNEYMNVEDASKNPVRALAVFSKCIKYLVDDFIEEIQR